MTSNKVSDYLVHMFAAPPGERIERDIHAILPIVMMKTNCLKNLEKEMVAYILQVSRLVQYDADDVIVKQGDVGETFYIILRGSVSIFVDTKQDGKEKTPAVGAATSRTHEEATSGDDGRIRSGVRYSARPSLAKSGTRQRKKTADDSAKAKMEEARRKRRSVYGHVVVTFGQYQSFGELALLYANRTRNASALADDRASLLEVSGDVFRKTLQETLERDLEEKKMFIQTHPFFSTWHTPMQRQLQWSLTRSSHKLGSCVTSQGEPVKGLHFLISGRARLAAEPLRHRQQFPAMFGQQVDPVHTDHVMMHREDSSLSAIAKDLRCEKSDRHLLGITPLTYIRRRDGYAAAEKLVLDRLVDLCLIEEGEVVCDFELLLGLNRNIFTVICSSTCTWFHLNTKVFDRLICKKNPHTLSMVKLLAETKLARRIASPQGQRVTILGPLMFRVMNVRVVDPFADKKQKHVEGGKSDRYARIEKRQRMRMQAQTEKSNNVLVHWFIQGRTPLLQPITKDAIYYREMMQQRAQNREDLRQRVTKDKQPVKSLERRVKEAFITNLKEGLKAQTRMRKLKLQNSDLTPVSRWK